MESLWILYWIAIAISFAFGLYCVFKRHVMSGTLQCLLSMLFTGLTIYVGLASKYSGRGISEFQYFLSRLVHFQFDAILIIVLLIILLCFNIFHIASINVDKQSIQ